MNRKMGCSRCYLSTWYIRCFFSQLPRIASWIAHCPVQLGPQVVSATRNVLGECFSFDGKQPPRQLVRALTAGGRMHSKNDLQWKSRTDDRKLYGVWMNMDEYGPSIGFWHVFKRTIFGCSGSKFMMCLFEIALTSRCSIFCINLILYQRESCMISAASVGT